MSRHLIWVATSTQFGFRYRHVNVYHSFLETLAVFTQCVLVLLQCSGVNYIVRPLGAELVASGCKHFHTVHLRPFSGLWRHWAFELAISMY